MSTPKGISCYTLHLANDDNVFVYHGTECIILQLRRKVPTESDLLQPSIKFAVPLKPEEALSLAAELTGRHTLLRAKQANKDEDVVTSFIGHYV